MRIEVEHAGQAVVYMPRGGSEATPDRASGLIFSCRWRQTRRRSAK